MSHELAGTFYGVGVGPGDPELMTLKAARVLSEVERIYAPSGLGGDAGVARTVVGALGLPAEKFRPVDLPMVRDRDTIRRAYRDASAEIVRDLQAGQSVAWVTEGDPLFYSTFLHLHDELRDLAPWVTTRIVPGVTSISAAAARAVWPIARLDQGVAVFPAAYGVDRLPAALERFTTVCLMKINSAYDTVLDRLASVPWPLQTLYAERVGMPGERLVTDLEALRGRRLPYFSMVLLRREDVADRDRDPRGGDDD